MTDQRRRISLIFLLVLTTVILLMAGFLPGLRLKPGIPLPWVTRQTGDGEVGPVGVVTISLNTFFLAILGAVLLMLLVYAAYNMLRGVNFREIVKPALILAGLTLGAVCVLFLIMNVNITTSPQVKETLPPTLEVQGPPLGPMPPALIWLILAGMGIAVLALAVWLIRWSSRRRSVVDPLQLEAERAVRSLKNGQDFKSVVLRCYQQMSLVLQKEQGFELEMSMTAREFERLLEARGVPSSPVRQLTRLFEFARYGVNPPTREDEAAAVDCLNAIVQYSRTRERQAGSGAR